MGLITEQELIDTINGADETPTTVVDTQPQAGNNNTPTPNIPTSDESVETVTTDTPTAPPSFSLDDELQKISNGEIKSKEDLAEILGKSKGLSELEAKLKTIEEENTSLKAKADVNPFANDFTKKMNDLYKSGVPQHTIDAFVRINKVENIDDLQPIEARKLALQIKEGLTAEEAESYIKGTYKLNQEDPDDDVEAQSVRLANIKLKVDANADKEFLKTHKAEVSQLPVDNSAKLAENRAQQIKVHIDTITPIAKSVMNDISFKDININGKDGEAAVKMDLEISPESRLVMEKRMAEIIKNSSPEDFSDVNVAMQEIAKGILISENWKKWLADATNTREKSVRAEYNNPTTPNRGDDNPNAGKTSKDELGEWLLQNA